MLERAARPVRGFANGLASGTDAVYRSLGAPGRLLQDFMNGTWLGHTLHAVLVDVVVGGSTAALLLDLMRVVFGVEGLETATMWVLALAALSAVGAILTGVTDYKDTAPESTERDVTALHGLVNIGATVLFGVSLAQRVAAEHDAAFWLLLVAYALVSVGSYIGGHVVYKYGYMVNRNAFNRGKRAKDFTPVVAAAALPDGMPIKVMFGSTAVMVLRRGDVVHALKDSCSHAGGPLSDGELDGDTITCPWHRSTFRLADGSVVHGPASSRQPSYRARIAGDQVELHGPHD